jgi:hypothetical protein
VLAAAADLAGNPKCTNCSRKIEKDREKKRQCSRRIEREREKER